MSNQEKQILSQDSKVAVVGDTKIPASGPHGKSPKRGSSTLDSTEARSVKGNQRRKQGQSRNESESLQVRTDLVVGNKGMDRKRRSDRPDDLKRAPRFIVFIRERG